MEARVAARKAIGKDRILCLECGGSFRQLTNTHLRRHGLTATEYKRKWGYKPDRFLACEELRDLYAERHRQLIASGRFTPHRPTPSEARRGARAKKPKSLEQILSFRERYTEHRYAAREPSYERHPREKQIPLVQLIRLRGTGWSLKAPARRFGVSRPTISRRLGHPFPSDYQAKYRPPFPRDRGGGTIPHVKDPFATKEVQQ